MKQQITTQRFLTVESPLLIMKKKGESVVLVGSPVWFGPDDLGSIAGLCITLWFLPRQTRNGQ